MLWVNAIISISSCLLFCLYFGCAAHCQSQWWSHCQVSPSGLAYAKCSCTSAHICASSCVVGPLCSLKGVAQCVSLHSVHLLCGQVSRGKECEFMVFKMRVFPFFFPVKYLVCFNVSEITGNFFGPFVIDWQNEVRLSLCWFLGQTEPYTLF